MKNLILPLIFISLVACQPTVDKSNDPTRLDEKSDSNTVNTKNDDEVIISPDAKEALIPKKVEQQDFSSGLPESVLTFIQSYRKECGQKDQIADYKFLVKQADLNADQKTEYILEPADFMCEDPNLMYGRGGTEIFIFGQAEQGEVKQLFSHVMFAYELTAKTEAKSQQLWLDLGGSFCGQDMDQISTAEAIACKRLVGFNTKTKAFELTEMKIDK